MDHSLYDPVRVLVLSLMLFVASGDRGLWGDKAVHLNELHHFYIGVVLFALGGLLMHPWMGTAGVVIAADDAWQHTVQTLGRRPEYESVLHRAYGWLWVRIAPLRWLDTLLDHLLRHL